MSSNDNSIEVKIGGDASEMKSVMNDSASTVDQKTRAMSESFEQLNASLSNSMSALKEKSFSIGEAFEAMQKPLLTMTAILGGGAVFKETISVANSLNGEALKLSRSLGITGEEAAALRTALGDIYTDSDTYIGAFQKFAKQIKSNEQGLQDMGLQTRDSNGHLRDSNTLFREALTVVGDYKPGLDQTTAAMTLFGKGVDDVMKLQKLNNDVLDDAQQKNEQLGMTLTQEGVAATKRYKAAMNDVGDVMEAVKNQIGKAVMPVFTELGEYFASTGPYVINVFKGALTGLLAAFRVVQGAVQVISGTIFEALNVIIDGAGLLGEVFSKLIHRDFGGAADAAKALGSRVGQGFKNAFMNFVDVGNEVGDKVKSDMDRIWGNGTKVDMPKGGSKAMGEFKDPKKDKEGPGRMPEFEAALAAKKDAIEREAAEEGKFRELSKQEEADYWAQLLQRTDLTTKERALVQSKYYASTAAVRKDAFTAEINDLQAQKEAAAKNFSERVTLAEKVYRKIADAYGEESKEAKKAYGEVLKERQKLAEQIERIDKMRHQAELQRNQIELDAERQHALDVADLVGATASQKLEIERNFLDRRYQLDLADAERAVQGANPERDPEEYQKLCDKKLEIEARYRAQLRQLTDKQDAAGFQPGSSFIDGMSSSIGNGFAQILAQTKNWRQGMIGIFQGVRDSFIKSVITDPLQAQIAGWAKSLAIKLGFLGQEKAADAAAASTKIGITTGEASVAVAANAAKAGTGAAASQAAIPIVGPGLALAAMAATFAAVSAMGGKIRSASGGFDIPKGVNPMTQLHQEEMVLPAHIANPLRESIASGGSMGGQASPRITIQAMDSRDVYRSLRKGGALERAMKGMNRDFTRI